MNIQRLKSDIWNNIEKNLVVMSPMEIMSESPSTAQDEENVNPFDGSNVRISECKSSFLGMEKNVEHSSGRLSFQSMVTDLSLHSKQKDVSLPFYFICLLHLANENVSDIFVNSIPNQMSLHKFIVSFDLVFAH